MRKSFRAAALAACVVAVAFAFALPPAGGSAGGLTEALGRFHVLVLHLPIGATVATVLAEGIAIGARSSATRDRATAALSLLVPFTFASAAVAFVLGVLLARSGGHAPGALAWHRYLSIGALVACAAATIAWTSDARRAFRGLLAVTAALVLAGSHAGGSLTHGEGFLRLSAAAPPAPAPPSSAAPASGSGTVYADVLAPLLREHCVECHGPEKAKGRLRLDSIEAMQAGGKHGAALVAHASRESEIVARMRLPEDDDARMPPTTRKPPPPGMVDLLALWIDRGADPNLRVEDVLVPEPARALLEGAAKR